MRLSERPLNPPGSCGHMTHNAFATVFIERWKVGTGSRAAPKRGRSEARARTNPPSCNSSGGPLRSRLRRCALVCMSVYAYLMRYWGSMSRTPARHMNGRAHQTRGKQRAPWVTVTCHGAVALFGAQFWSVPMMVTAKGSRRVGVLNVCVVSRLSQNGSDHTTPC